MDTIRFLDKVWERLKAFPVKNVLVESEIERIRSKKRQKEIMSIFYDGFCVFDDTILFYDGEEKKKVVPDSVRGIRIRHIGAGAFLGNENLFALEIAEGIETIGIAAFEGCTRLSRVTFPATLQSIGYEAFKDCSIKNSEIKLRFTKYEYEQLLVQGIRIGIGELLINSEWFWKKWMDPVFAETKLYGERPAVLQSECGLYFAEMQDGKICRVGINEEAPIGTEEEAAAYLIRQQIREREVMECEKNDERMLEYDYEREYTGKSLSVALLDRAGIEQIGDNVVAGIILQKGKIFVPAVMRIALGGCDYYVYRRLYLTEDPRYPYVKKDQRILDSKLAKPEYKKNLEIMAKYAFLSSLI